MDGEVILLTEDFLISYLLLLSLLFRSTHMLLISQKPSKTVMVLIVGKYDPQNKTYALL